MKLVTLQVFQIYFCTLIITNKVPCLSYIQEKTEPRNILDGP